MAEDAAELGSRKDPLKIMSRAAENNAGRFFPYLGRILTRRAWKRSLKKQEWFSLSWMSDYWIGGTRRPSLALLIVGT
jgi:hypothetical protein